MFFLKRKLPIKQGRSDVGWDRTGKTYFYCGLRDTKLVALGIGDVHVNDDETRSTGGCIRGVQRRSYLLEMSNMSGISEEANDADAPGALTCRGG